MTLPVFDVEVVPVIPADVVADAGVGLTRENGVLTIGLDFASVLDNAGISDPSKYTVLAWSVDDERYEEVRIDVIAATSVGEVRTPVGDANYTILQTDRYVALTATLTAPRTWSLPAASAVPPAREIDIRDEAGGISSTNTLTIATTGADTVNGAGSLVLTGARSGVQIRSDGVSKWTAVSNPVALSQLSDPELLALGGLTSAADKLAYFTGSGTAALANFAAAARSLLGLTAAADRLPYFDGGATAALATFTAAGRALIDDADTTAQRATLGLANSTTANRLARFTDTVGSTGQTSITEDAAGNVAGIVSINAGPLAGLRNRIINPSFAINQRAYASGAALAAGAFGHDRWKAGSGGATYTFSQAKVDTTITITAGTLVQAIEDVNVEGGVYVLSWTGTAQARVAINGAATTGAYAASPLAVPSATAGQQITVEFNTGTLGKVQLEPGTLATLFERRMGELMLCQRYYERGVFKIFVASATTVAKFDTFKFTKAKVPTIVQSAAAFGSTVNGTQEALTAEGLQYSNAGAEVNFTWAVSAEF